MRRMSRGWFVSTSRQSRCCGDGHADSGTELLVRSLQTCRGVHGVAISRIIELRPTADIANDGLSAFDTDAGTSKADRVRARMTAEQCGPFPQCDRTVHCPSWMIDEIQRGIE